MKVRTRFPLVLTGFTAAALAILVALGLWQLQRLEWKTTVLERMKRLEAAAPQDAAAVLNRGGDTDFVRVRLACPQLETSPVLRLYSVRDGVAGNRLIAACALNGGPYRSVLVDRGFLAGDGVTSAPAQPYAPPAAGANGPVIGLLRAPDARTFVTPPNQPAQNLWYWRDVSAMAAALKAERPAPVFLMLEQPAPASGPKPAALPEAVSNRHMEYALTWFGLAGALLAVYAAMLRRRLTAREQA